MSEVEEIGDATFFIFDHLGFIALVTICSYRMRTAFERQEVDQLPSCGYALRTLRTLRMLRIKPLKFLSSSYFVMSSSLGLSFTQPTMRRWLF
jgi:hypothetical protein